MLRDLQRKAAKARRVQEKRKLRDTERQRRLSYIRTQRAEEQARQESTSAEQAAKERHALEREWEARTARRRERKALTQAQLRRYTDPTTKVAKATGKVALRGLEATGRASFKGLKALDTGVMALSKRMRIAEEKEQTYRPPQKSSDEDFTKWLFG